MNNIMKILNFLLIIIEIKMYINIMKYSECIVYVLLLVLISYIILNTYTKNIESFSQKTIKENVVCNPIDGKTLSGLRKHHLGISDIMSVNRDTITNKCIDYANNVYGVDGYNSISVHSTGPWFTRGCDIHHGQSKKDMNTRKSNDKICYFNPKYNSSKLNDKELEIQCKDLYRRKSEQKKEQERMLREEEMRRLREAEEIRRRKQEEERRKQQEEQERKMFELQIRKRVEQEERQKIEEKIRQQIEVAIRKRVDEEMRKRREIEDRRYKDIQAKQWGQHGSFEKQVNNCLSTGKRTPTKSADRSWCDSNSRNNPGKVYGRDNKGNIIYLH